MSRWTHPICPDCWAALEPGRTPHALIDRTVETCCRCGEPTGAGIYYRADPAALLCGGEHP
jgi:hypothetical protein